MTKNILIFGISGQDGFYLKKLCESKGYHVIGIARSAGDWIQGSVADREFVYTLIKEHQPYCVFHLAANSSTKHEYVYENNDTICNGSLHILEAVYQHSKKSKVFLSGSGLQFVNKGQPIKETNEFFAGSPYAAQRIYTTYLARYYRTLGVQTYVGYFFHHDSPFRTDRHLNVQIINELNAIKQNKAAFLEIGNPNVVKEYNFAVDLMDAVWLLVNQERVFEAVIGSGKGHSISDWVNICSRIIGLPPGDYIKIQTDFDTEFYSMTCNPETIQSLGWQADFDITKLAALMINHMLFNDQVQ